MCGIAGIVYKNKRPLVEEIKLMTDALAHRGPDGEGFYLGKNLALGHRRLAIIDLSPAASQPMRYQTKDGELVIVYNGEVYNYIELRKELELQGYVFRSNSDTEVILASYDRWGTDCLSKFNGMWAFVIYDKNKNILFGARDRFGVKPFYYTLNETLFAFASELKALLKLPINRTLNLQSVFDYLLFGKEETQEEGFFKGIFELMPSWAFIFHLQTFQLNKWQYYKLSYVDHYEKFNKKKLTYYANDLRQLILRAVEIRLRSDVPIGTCLSGGLDSSSIILIVNEFIKSQKIEQIGERQKVFTACYTDLSADESKWAKIIVDHTRSDWHRTYPHEEELLQDLEDLIYTQEIPFYSTSIYAQYKIMKLAREVGVKVLLDGQGGDELFGGYPAYYPLLLRELLLNLDIQRLFQELRQLGNSPVNLKFVAHMLLKDMFLKYFPCKQALLLAKSFTRKINYINPEFYHLFKHRSLYYIETLPTHLNQLLYQDITGQCLKSLLRYEDRNSMRFSIEARTPFADDIQLIEYMFKIPASYKIHNGWSKFLLRTSLNGILPPPIQWRKDKVGFATPEKKWLTNKISWILQTLQENKELVQDFVEVDKVITDLKDGNIFKVPFLLWRIINLLLWRIKFNL